MGLEDAFKAQVEKNKPAEQGEQGQATQDKVVETGQLTTEEVKIDLSSLNKKYNQNFESEDQLQSLFSLPEKLKVREDEFGKYKSDYEVKLAKITEYEGKIAELSKPFDVRSVFANDDLYKANELIKKYPGKDISVMNKIVATDEDKASDFDLLTLNELLTNPKIKGGEKGARELIASEYGLDVDDMSNIPDVVFNKMAKRANEVRDSFKSMKSIEVPAPIDFNKLKSDSELAARKAYEAKIAATTPVAKKMIEDFKKFTVEDEVDGKKETIFEYDVVLSGDEKQAIEAQVSRYIASQPEVDETVLQNALNIRDSLYEQMKRKDMWKHFRSQLQTQAKDEKHKELHNDASLSDATRPANTNDWQTNFKNNLFK